MSCNTTTSLKSSYQKLGHWSLKRIKGIKLIRVGVKDAKNKIQSQW